MINRRRKNKLHTCQQNNLLGGLREKKKDDFFSLLIK